MRHTCVLLFALPLMIAGCSSKSSDDNATARAAASPRAVSAGAVALRPMTSRLALSGLLVPREEAAVSSQLSGYPVARVLVDLDDPVRAGQPLAILDDVLLRADIAQQRAVLAQQRVAAEKARTEAGRVAGLENSGVLSAEAIAERRLAARSADASVAQAQAALQSLLVKQGLMTIRAPVAGRILSRVVRPGDIAAPATVMFRIARDNLIELDAEVPEQSINLIRVGQNATVKLPTGEAIPGTIRLVSAEIDAQTKLGRARILMAPDRRLRPGGFAQASLTVGQRTVAAVPETAMRSDATGTSVMVLDQSNRVRLTPIKAGIHADGWVTLERGPPPGTRILTGGQGFVLDGDTVKPQVAR